jgi:hypothetical protein
LIYSGRDPNRLAEPILIDNMYVYKKVRLSAPGSFPTFFCIIIFYARKWSAGGHTVDIDSSVKNGILLPRRPADFHVDARR